MASAEAATPHFPLSDFQRLMLYWNQVQPFHVADVVEVVGRVDVGALKTAAEQELAATCIALPHVDLASGICTLHPGSCAVEATALTPVAGIDARQTLEAHATSELRRPFQINAEPLIRVWVLQGQACSYVGMTWQHWIADGMAAGDLLRRILARLHGWAVPPETTLSDWRPPDIREALAPWFTWRRKLRHAWEVVHAVTSNFFVAKLPRPSGAMPATRIRFLELPDDSLERIRRAGRPLQATVNDVLVAVAARALTEAAPGLTRSSWRRRMRLGNIVDLRPLGGEALRGKGGVFLGLTNVDCVQPLPARWEDLVAEVRQQSNRSKIGRYYLASLGGFRMSRALWPWLPATWRRPVNANVLRLTAVLTNLRYPKEWYDGAAPEITRCWRALPMGIMYPLVFGITTLGERLTMTMSCDEVGPVADRAVDIIEQMQRGLAKL